MPIFHYPKGSPEAKAHMARLRAIRDAKRAANPLTTAESNEILSASVRSSRVARDLGRHGKQVGRASRAGIAEGLAEAVVRVGDRAQVQRASRISRVAAAEGLNAYQQLKARGVNPLSVAEAQQILARVRDRIALAMGEKESLDPDKRPEAGFDFGVASGQAWAVADFGPRKTRKEAKTLNDSATVDAVRVEAKDKEYHKMLRARQRNSPMLVLGNPASDRKPVELKKNPDGSFEALVRRVAKSPGPNLPAELLAHPRFKRELRAYIKRHGAGPIEVKIVNAPDGYPYVASSWGKSPNVVYDAPRHSNKGKRIHHFGEGGGKKPDLISSVEKGPKFLAFVDGTFRADGEWILK